MPLSGYPFHSAVGDDSVLVGRSPWTARDAPVPLPDAEAGASARARAPALHDFAGDVWLSQVDTHSPLFQNAKALVCERRRRDPRAIPVRPSATGEEDDCRVELVLRRRNPRRFTMAGTLYTAMRTAKIG